MVTDVAQERAQDKARGGHEVDERADMYKEYRLSPTDELA